MTNQRSYVVVTLESTAREAKLLFEVSEIETWRVEMPHHRILEIVSCERNLWISAWSQPVVTRREGVSLAKLLFGVLEIVTWRVEMHRNRNSQYAKS
jgi:hypothetical protein